MVSLFGNYMLLIIFGCGALAVGTWFLGKKNWPEPVDTLIDFVFLISTGAVLVSLWLGFPWSPTKPF